MLYFNRYTNPLVPRGHQNATWGCYWNIIMVCSCKSSEIIQIVPIALLIVSYQLSLNRQPLQILSGLMDGCLGRGMTYICRLRDKSPLKVFILSLHDQRGLALMGSPLYLLQWRRDQLPHWFFHLKKKSWWTLEDLNLWTMTLWNTDWWNRKLTEAKKKGSGGLMLEAFSP